MNDSKTSKFDLRSLQRNALPSLADLQSGQPHSLTFPIPLLTLVLGCTIPSLVDIQSDRPELPSLKTFQSDENVFCEPEEEKVMIEIF